MGLPGAPVVGLNEPRFERGFQSLQPVFHFALLKQSRSDLRQIAQRSTAGDGVLQTKGVDDGDL
jgi:hypothetical protein